MFQLDLSLTCSYLFVCLFPSTYVRYLINTTWHCCSVSHTYSKHAYLIHTHTDLHFHIQNMTNIYYKNVLVYFLIMRQVALLLDWDCNDWLLVSRYDNAKWNWLIWSWIFVFQIRCTSGLNVLSKSLNNLGQDDSKNFSPCWQNQIFIHLSLSHTYTHIQTHSHTRSYDCSLTLLFLTHTHTHTHTYTHTHTTTKTWLLSLSLTHTQSHTYTHKHTHTHTGTHDHMITLSLFLFFSHTHTDTHIHTHIYTHTHTHINIHTHTHTLTQRHTRFLSLVASSCRL